LIKKNDNKKKEATLGTRLICTTHTYKESSGTLTRTAVTKISGEKKLFLRQVVYSTCSMKHGIFKGPDET